MWKLLYCETDETLWVTQSLRKTKLLCDEDYDGQSGPGKIAEVRYIEIDIGVSQ